MKKIQLGGHTKSSTIRGWALVDDDDFIFLNQWNWSMSTVLHLRYASRHRKVNENWPSAMISMHRFILQITDPAVEIDHINGDGLDNRRSNLRICSHKENTKNKKMDSRNSTSVTGVYWFKARNKWHARITANGESIHLGFFEDFEMACKIRREAEIKYFKEFRRK